LTVRLTTIAEVRHVVPELMRMFPAPWCVAGGWAIDLFLGVLTRPHADLEIAIFRPDQAALHAYFTNYEFKKCRAGKMEIWRPGDKLSLPIHELHGSSRDHSSQTIEFLLNERQGDDWAFRRAPSIRMPVERWFIHIQSLPVLSPEIVLLYKAKQPRPKDEHDFQLANERLGGEQREWFRSALQTCHPGHPWLGRLR
jgi:hypothetical protein